MVDADRDKPTVIALREIAAGKIGIEMLTKTEPRCPRSRRVDAKRCGPVTTYVRDRANSPSTWGTTCPRLTSRSSSRAFEFSETAHRGQFRKSGEPYITHPLAVASILSQWRLDAQGLAAALLHDVMEDTSVTKSELETDLRQAGGRHGRRRVQARPDPVRHRARTVQAESFRKMLLAMARDVRVILIKLADRLHNMRTLDAMAPVHRKRIARETLDIYAPIANRLGLNSLYLELQDLSFKHLNPMRYRILSGAIKAARGNRREVMNRLLDVDPRGPREGRRRSRW